MLSNFEVPPPLQGDSDFRHAYHLLILTPVVSKRFPKTETWLYNPCHFLLGCQSLWSCDF